MKKPGGLPGPAVIRMRWLSDDPVNKVDGSCRGGLCGIPAFSREAFAVDLPRENRCVAEVVNFDLVSIADFRAEETVERRVPVSDDRCDWFHYFFSGGCLGYLQSRAY